MRILRYPAGGVARTRSPGVRHLLVCLVAFAFAAFAASALAGSHAAKGSFVFTGQQISSADPVMVDPFYRTGRSSCTQVGTLARATGPFHYKSYKFLNLRGSYANGVGTPADTCVNVSLLVQAGSAGATAYSPAFNPLPRDSELLGTIQALAAGQSGDIGVLVQALFGFRQPYGFEVVVYETVAAGDSASYTLLVEGTGIVMSGSGTPTSADGVQSFRASAAPKGVLVRWRTRAERDALGFNVYRGDTKKVRLTRSIVRASGDGRGHTYSYLDRSARKGKAAPYYLEVVQRGGSKIMFGPALTTTR